MDNKDQQEKSQIEYNDNIQNDYNLLVQKLKSIKKIIEKLEKNFLENEI